MMLVLVFVTAVKKTQRSKISKSTTRIHSGLWLSRYQFALKTYYKKPQTADITQLTINGQ